MIVCDRHPRSAQRHVFKVYKPTDRHPQGSIAMKAYCLRCQAEAKARIKPKPELIERHWCERHNRFYQKLLLKVYKQDAITAQGSFHTQRYCRLCRSEANAKAAQRKQQQAYALAAD